LLTSEAHTKVCSIDVIHCVKTYIGEIGMSVVMIAVKKNHCVCDGYQN
jgi:hypothetical protein